MIRRTFIAAAATASAITLSACANMSSEPDIVDIAVGNENFTTLVAAVGAAGLVETLKSDGPFTVFAPTNAAFDKLPDGTVASLLEPENLETLRSILTYHVIAGKVLAADVVNLDRATTVNGKDVQISVKNGSVYVNKSKVITADIVGSNGVIHVIDSVLLP
ncbi:fasciclin domain-containing protein [Falsihalocynthiibacter sp. SS001]|uniref:fasciclin domain-containing protein n=1 Tax=Falsihalocynthiibacter sp. SS001 TaxID=3349698 RepID=UPI0036D43F4F